MKLTAIMRQEMYFSLDNNKSTFNLKLTKHSLFSLTKRSNYLLGDFLYSLHILISLDSFHSVVRLCMLI